MSSSAADAAWIFYGYSPSYALPIVSAVLFGIAFLAHLFLFLRTKSYYVCLFLPTLPSHIPISSLMHAVADVALCARGTW